MTLQTKPLRSKEVQAQLQLVASEIRGHARKLKIKCIVRCGPRDRFFSVSATCPPVRSGVYATRTALCEPSEMLGPGATERVLRMLDELLETDRLLRERVQSLGLKTENPVVDTPRFPLDWISHDN